MTLDEIDEGSAVFIDANVFIYHFAGASPQRTNLMERCRSGEVRGATSVLVLAEVCHRLMMIEAVKRDFVSPGNLARKLATRSNLARQLVTYEADVEAIPAMRIEVAVVTAADLTQAFRFQRRYGLLTNDSLILATMLRDEFRLLATADRRFATVPEIETAVPTDLLKAN